MYIPELLLKLKFAKSLSDHKNLYFDNLSSLFLYILKVERIEINIVGHLISEMV